MKVYISVGTPTNDIQKSFLDGLILKLRSKGLEPIVYGYTVPGKGKALSSIDKYLSESCGFLAIAYQKYHIEKGTDYIRGEKTVPLENVSLSTSWNHIETTLAYSKGLTPLMLVEKSIYQTGVLEITHDWHVYNFDINQDLSADLLINNALEDWINDARKFATAVVSQTKDKTKKSILDKNAGIFEIWSWVRSLDVFSQFTLGSILISVFTSVFYLGVNTAEVKKDDSKDNTSSAVSKLEDNSSDEVLKKQYIAQIRTINEDIRVLDDKMVSSLYVGSYEWEKSQKIREQKEKDLKKIETLLSELMGKTKTSQNR